MGIIGNYEIKDMIAEGGFARIYQAKHVLLEEMACIKQCKVNSDDYTNLLRQEAKLLWKLSDYHSIPHAKDFMQMKDGTGIMIMNYIDGKTLDTIMPDKSRMHPEDASWVTQRLLEALYYCHSYGVIHSDIKPGNVIIEPKKHDIKLIDFGLAINKPKGSTVPIGYTEAYAAPELIDGKPPIPETDIYGAGVVMLYALGGDPLSKILPPDVPEPLADFCNAMLRYNPMERPSWERDNLIQRIGDIRLEVFGRKHTSESTPKKTNYNK